MIRLEHVSKTFAGSRSGAQANTAVDDVSLDVGGGELCVLIGPSGSGKTTTMRMINRLELSTAGHIFIEDRDIASLDEVTLRRKIGYVIQQVGLFPHFTVADNVSIVPRLLGWPAAKRRQRAEELLELVGLDPRRYALRYPRQLSGGQQQRVGVARALAADPPIVLMDEPFGAVDPITRKQLQRELRRIQAEVRKTIVFVTHDINEAFLLGDRVVLMREGRVVQNGTPADLLRRPEDSFVTSFIGEDRALESLQHTPLAELAAPAPAGTVATQADLVLPGSVSVLEGLRRLGAHGRASGDFVWVSDEAGRANAILSFKDLVVALSATLADDQVKGGRPADDAVLAGSA